MCGIIGVIGNKTNANQIVVHGLKNLEYRGYDSWGIAYINKPVTNDRIQSIKTKIIDYKAIGKLADASNLLEEIESKPANIAIGHTRWATHGAVTQANSHPHFSCNGNIALVHNGIIENFQTLHRNLQARGHKFKSETDTEAIAHLIEEERAHAKSLAEAVGRAIQSLKGSFALAVFEAENNELVGARRGSPLVIGIGDDQLFLASDVPAFLNQTRQVIFLDDNDLVRLHNSEATLYSLKTGRKKQAKVNTIEWNPEQAKRGDWPHFMIKEIHEQPETILRAIAHPKKRIEEISFMINQAFGSFFTACGSAYHAALAATYLFSHLAQKHVNVAVASEFPNYEHFLKKRTLLIPISQSGETADTLSAVKAAKKRGSQVLGIVNVQGSTLTREAHDSILTQAGPEICVLATKSFTSQLALVTLLAYSVAGEYQKGRTIVEQAAQAVKDFLANDATKNQIKKIARRIAKRNDLYTIGRSLNYPTALEAALKIKEVSYIHAEGFAGGELKHGSIALIEKDTPVLVFAANDEVHAEIISNAMEVKARGAYAIGISPQNNEVFDEWIKVADLPTAMPIVGSVPAQLLAYELALARRTDPDKPRNLAKSVTVK